MLYKNNNGIYGGFYMYSRELRDIESYHYEAKSMAQCVLNGYTLKQIMQEFDVSRDIVVKRLNSIGYTFQELVEIREIHKKSIPQRAE